VTGQAGGCHGLIHPVGRVKIGPFWPLVPEFYQHPDQAGVILRGTGKG